MPVVRHNAKRTGKILAQEATDPEIGQLPGAVVLDGVRSRRSSEWVDTGAEGARKRGTTLSNYAYAVGDAGNRLSVAEQGGRTVTYGYNHVYKLTSEAVAPNSGN
jgi:hypothetical protein